VKTVVLIISLFLLFSLPVTSVQPKSLPHLSPISESPEQLQLLKRFGEGWINDIAWSSDSKSLAVATSIGVYFYDAQDLEKSPTRLEESISLVRDVVFSDNGQYLAVSGKRLQVWDTKTGALYKELQDIEEARLLTFRPDSNQLAFSNDGSVSVWNFKTESEVQNLSKSFYVRDLTYSRDNKRIAAIVTGGEMILGKVWDIESGELFNDFIPTYIDDLVATPDSKGWVGIDRDIQRWDATFEYQIASTPIVSKGDSDNFTATAAVSSSQEAVFFLSRAGVLRRINLKDLDTELEITVGWEGHIAQFNADTNRLATATRSQIQIWDVTNGEQIAEHTRFAIPVPVAFSPDRQYFVTVDNGNYDLSVWNTTTATVVSYLRGHIGDTTTATFSAGGGLVASTGHDGTVRVWDVLTGKLQEIIFTPNRDVRFLLFGGDVNLYMISNNSTVEGYSLIENRFFTVSWDFEKNVPLTRTQQQDDQRITSLSERNFVTASQSGELYFKMGDGPEWYTLVLTDTLRRPFNAFAFTHAETIDDLKIAVAGNNGVVQLLDFHRPDPTTITPLTRHNSWIYTLEFSPDDKVLASGGCAETKHNEYLYGSAPFVVPYCDGAELQLWYSLDSASPLFTYDVYKQFTVAAQHTMPIRKLLFNPEGTLLATASDDGTIMLWGVPEER
jgi:WD40 repeat protein